MVALTTHGHYKGKKASPTYVVWMGMRSRCKHKSNPSFKRYGALGVTVCEQWDKSFAAFLKDAGERPSLRHQLDRIDGTKGYEPGNVRWVTSKEQQRNRRNNVRVTINGVTKVASAWAEETRISAETFRKRLRAGWEPQRALMTPSRRE